MQIKEIETESGMTRANIRFYEAEGLLEPERGPNGYREYSEDDLEILRRIKLLRALHISLEEIKSLHTGQCSLVDVLDRHLVKLQREKTEMEQAQEICQIMRDDGVRYRTLDAQRYLDTMERSPEHSIVIPSSDILPEICIPWRRYFARSADIAFYTALWNIFLALALHIKITARSGGGGVLDNIVVLVLMFVLEPVLLSLFGTTPGKWILGIRVTDNEGDLMTYRDALARTWSVLLRGMGLGIPFYSLFRLWESYKADTGEETLDWEYHSAITLKDEKSWRIFAYFGLYAALIGVLLLSVEIAEMPKNRGDITVAEFCQNYNRYAKYYGSNTDSHLDTQGRWVRNDSMKKLIYYAGNQNDPTFIFEESDGLMTGMRFIVHIQNLDEVITGRPEYMILSILAFAGAQKENGLFKKEVEKIVIEIFESPFQSHQFSVYGVNITCNVEYAGYYDTKMGVLFPLDDAEYSYSLSFSMQKEGGR